MQEPATDSEITDLHRAIQEIDPDWRPSMTTKIDIEKSPKLTHYINKHFVILHKYIILAMNCNDADCGLCPPLRMPESVYIALRSRPGVVLFHSP